MKVKIEDIDTENRFRGDFGDIEKLAESIKRHGLIHPPVVTEDMVLVAGERRLRACMELDLEEIEVRLISELPELERREIELEENLHRKAFTWQEEVKAKEEIHRIKQLSHGERIKGHDSEGWGVKDTAEALDESLGTVSQDIQLAKAIEEYPEVSEEKNKHRAWKKFKKLQEQETLEELADSIGDKQIGELYELVNADCIEWMQEQPDESFDMAISDPPWGIDMQSKRRSNQEDIEYEDKLDLVLETIDLSIRELYRILKPDSHLYLWFGITNYPLFCEIVEDAGFNYDPVPLIWNKGSGSTGAKGRTYPKAYDPCLFCWKGDRMIRGTEHNIFTEKRPSNNTRIHSAQKPIPLARLWIRNSSKPGEKIIVPFGGSGSDAVAAVMEKRKVVAIEKSKKNFAAMTEFVQSSLAEHLLEKEMEG